MSRQNGSQGSGESEHLAPVIPLFGGVSPSGDRVPARGASVPPSGDRVPARGASTSPSGDRVPARSAGVSRSSQPDEPTWHTSWLADAEEADEFDEDAIDDCTQIELEIAERNLLKKLRARSLSVREARAVIAERALDAETVDGLVQRFVHRGYLNDARLAEQLVHAGVDRKGQGRQAISRALSQRGIPRDVIDTALTELPDDDAERALEFARQKARSMRDLDRDTALRRLSGQLARRGYGSTALDAARQALDELASGPRGSRGSGVRFTEG